MLNRHPEYQYLELLKLVLEQGDRRIDRTGVGTLSIFGAMTRFDVSASAPILTTKRVYWKTAVKEMLWFLTRQNQYSGPAQGKRPHLDGLATWRNIARRPAKRSASRISKSPHRL